MSLFRVYLNDGEPVSPWLETHEEVVDWLLSRDFPDPVHIGQFTAPQHICWIATIIKKGTKT